MGLTLMEEKASIQKFLSKKKLISVIIPVYNVEKYIEKCIDSVINQTINLENLEIILVNDGSTDSSLKILKKYKEKYHNIILVDQENMGLGNARNSGLQHVSGRYIAFLDSDDHIPLDTYEKLYNATENETFDIVAGKMAYIDSYENIKHVTFNNLFNNNEKEISVDIKSNRKYWDLFRYGNVVYRIYKAELVIRNNLKFPGHMLMEDVPFSTPANLLAKNIKVINDVVYCYLQRADSIMGQLKTDSNMIQVKNKQPFIDIFRSIEVTYNNLKHNSLDEYKYIFDYIVLDNHLMYRDRIKEFISKDCIDLYSLTDTEFNYVSSICKSIIMNTSMETFSLLDTNKRNIYLDLKNEFKICDVIGTKVNVSIIIPVYNAAKYLRQCLDSLINQTFKEIEIICVNDGSTDNSLDIIKEYMKFDERIIVIDQYNQGAAVARNTGLDVAKGEYLHFLDSDDWLELNAIEILYKKAKTDDLDILNFYRRCYDITTNQKYIDFFFDKNQISDVYSAKCVPDILFKTGTSAVYNKLYKHSFIKDKKIRFQNLETCNDIYFAYYALALASKISIIDKPLITYRIHATNMSATRGTHWNCIFKAYEKLMKDLQSVFNKNVKLQNSFQEKMVLQFSYEYKHTTEKDKFIDMAKSLLADKQFLMFLKQIIKVSVIIPVYNVERYLRDCLDSVINQTLKEIEIICINDGSTDGSFEILKEYEKKDARIKIFSQENKGLSATRNVGIKFCQGEYINFLDSDDMLELNALELLYNKAFKDNLDILYFDAKTLFESNALLNEHKQHDDYYVRKNHYHIVCRGIDFFVALRHDKAYRSMVQIQLISRQYLNSIKLFFYEGIYHEDEFFTFKSMLLANRVCHLSQKLFIRRIRENSIMTEEKGFKHFYGYLTCYIQALGFSFNFFCTSTEMEYVLEQLKSLFRSAFNIYCQGNGFEQGYLDKLTTIERYIFNLASGQDRLAANRDYIAIAAKRDNLKGEKLMAKITIRDFFGKLRRKALKAMFGRELINSILQINQTEAILNLKNTLNASVKSMKTVSRDEIEQIVSRKTDALNSKIDTLGQKVDNLSQKTEATRHRIDIFNQTTGILGQKTDIMRQKTDILATKTDDMSRKADALSRKADEFTKKVDMLSKKSDDLSKKSDDLGKKIEEQKNKTIETRKRTGEILDALLFNSTIENCEWLSDKSFAFGGWAMDTAALYTVFRILNDVKPKNILEFGLGQSSKMVHQYANFFSDITALTVEHDQNWINFFIAGLNKNSIISVKQADKIIVNYNGFETASYDRMNELTESTKYDFVVVDGPIGSEHYSRSQIIEIAKKSLSEQFCILIDDSQRNGEQETVKEVCRILESKGINYLQREYSGEKKHAIICSEDLKFLLTLRKIYY